MIGVKSWTCWARHIFPFSFSLRVGRLAATAFLNHERVSGAPFITITAPRSSRNLARESSCALVRSTRLAGKGASSTASVAGSRKALRLSHGEW